MGETLLFNIQRGYMRLRQHGAYYKGGAPRRGDIIHHQPALSLILAEGLEHPRFRVFLVATVYANRFHKADVAFFGKYAGRHKSSTRHGDDTLESMRPHEREGEFACFLVSLRPGDADDVPAAVGGAHSACYGSLLKLTGLRCIVAFSARRRTKF